MNERKTPLAAAVFAVLYPALAPVAAAATTESVKLEAVVVTATRRAEDLQDVAQSVTALSTEFIEKQALTEHCRSRRRPALRQHRQQLAWSQRHRDARHLDRFRRIPR